MNGEKPRRAISPLFLKREVILATRPRTAVTCPHCWTDQRADRNVCYRCGAQFIYTDEMQQQDIKGA